MIGSLAEGGIPGLLPYRSLDQKEGEATTDDLRMAQSSDRVRMLLDSWHAFFNSRCLAGFPWFWPARSPGEPAMTEARRIVRLHFGQGHHPIARALARVTVAIAWPPAVLLHLCQIRRSRGPKAVPVKRFPGAFWAALRHNVEPGEYYAYQLWKPDRRANIDNYLYGNEAARLFKVLNRPLDPDPIGDKLAFYAVCRAQALPTPPILSAFAPTGKLMEFQCWSPPKRDLFIKPCLGRSGHSAERLLWRKSTFESDRGCRIRAADLDVYLSTRARNENQTLLVQPALWNHPSLSADHEALATARLVTGMSIDGNVVPIFGFIYFARSNSIKAQHGFVALIDVASGRLMSEPQDISGVKRSNGALARCDHIILPEWETAMQHAKAAHRACSNCVFVGWDIAFTDNGPTLLEGNINWNADEYQALTGQPLGRTKFAEVLSSRLGPIVKGIRI